MWGGRSQEKYNQLSINENMWEREQYSGKIEDMTKQAFQASGMCYIGLCSD